MREHDNEPIRGLPEELPSGERILWQSAPDFGAFARRALHTRKVAIYFGALIVFSTVLALRDGASFEAALTAALWPLALAVPTLALLYGLAYAMVRSTVYTITTKRVVMRFGVAIDKAFNIPFTVIDSAALKVFPDGSGNVSLHVSKGRDRISYIHLWPHVRPWRFTRSEPMLRAIPEAARVGAMLAEALRGEEPASMTAAPEQREASAAAVFGANSPAAAT